MKKITDIYGVSANTVESAKQAEEDGADYIGAGAVFKTSTKKDADLITMDTLKEICKSVSIHVVAIGGIDETNALELKGSGVDGMSMEDSIKKAKAYITRTLEAGLNLGSGSGPLNHCV